MYRALLRCYPRRFLEEYRLDMVQLFDDQLRDEPAIRVWLRGILDLAITVPVQHLEIHMTRPANTTVALSFASLSAASLVVGIAIGTNLAILAGAFAVAVIAGTLAFFAWRGG